MVRNYSLPQQIVEIGKQLVSTGLVIGTWGNISCLEPKKKQVIITPSGMDYNNLTQEDLVTLDLSGRILTGNRKPSSEKELHLEIYKNRPDVEAIVHTHSNYATSIAVTRLDLPPMTEDMVQLLGGPVKTADYAAAGSRQLAINAVQALGDINAVLLANHGVVGVGKNLQEALNVCLMVEKGAQLLVNSKILGKPYFIPDEDIKGMREFFLTQYGQRGNFDE